MIIHPSFFSRKYLVLAFLGILGEVLTQSQSKCGYGCQNCATDQIALTSSCQQCFNGFIYDKNSNLCRYQSCQSNLFYQPNSQTDYSSEGTCVSICSESYFTNFQQNICSPLNQCSQTYSTSQSYSNGQPIQKIVSYKDDYYIAIYIGFMNIISIQDGSFQAQITFPKGYSSIYYFLGEFYLLMQSGSILHWSIDSNYLQSIGQIQQGQVTANSILLNIQNENLSAVTFNSDNTNMYLSLVAQFTNSQINSLVNQQFLTISIVNQITQFFFDQFFIQINTQSGILSLSQLSFSDNLQQLNSQIILQTNDKTNYSTLGQIIDFQYQFTEQNVFYLIFSQSSQIYQFSQQLPNPISLDLIQKPQKIRFLNDKLSGKLIIAATQINFQIIPCSSFTLQQIIPIQFISGQINTPPQINDFLFLDNQYQVLVVLNNTQLFSFQWVKLNNQFQMTQQTIIDRKINAPSKICTFTNQNNQIVFLYNTDFQTLSFSTTQASTGSNLFVLQPYSLISPFTAIQINQIAYFPSLNIFSACSQDGQLKFWNQINRFEPQIFFTLQIQNQACLVSTALFDRYSLTVFSSQISIVDVFNQAQTINFLAKTSQKQLVSASSTNFLILQDGCITIYGINFNKIVQNCQATLYNTIISVQLLNSGQIIVQWLNQIQIWTFSTDQLIQNPTYAPNQSNYNINYFFTQFLPNDFNIVIFDSNFNLIILNSSLTQISLKQISYLKAIQSMYSIPSNPNCIIFIGISNNQSNPNPYILYYYNIVTGTITPISSYVLLLEILDIRFGKNWRDDYVVITAAVPLSYTFKIFRIFYYINLNINYLDLLKYTPTESFLYQVKIPDSNEVNSLYGAQSGFVGMNYLRYQYYQPILNVTSLLSQTITINNLLQSPTMNLYFIATNFTILVYNIHTDELLEQLSINQVDPIVRMSIFNDTQILVFNTQKYLFLKNYATSNSYQLNDFGNIVNYAQDQQGQRLYIFGSKLSSYDLNLKNEIVWYSFAANSGEQIKNCLLSSSSVACVSSSNRFILINLNTEKVQNQVMSTFSGQIQITQDPLNLNYFIYSSKIQVYSVYGIYKQDFPSYTGGLISVFNFYGSKIVLYSLGYVYIYDRNQYLLNANFLNQGSPALFQSIFIESQNIMLYFSEEIRYGQIQVYNLQLLISQNSISSNYAQNGIGRIINFSFDPEGNFLNTIDSYGNIMLFLVQATILNDSPLKIIEFDGQIPPQNYLINLSLNQMFIYSPYLVFKANYAQIAQAYVRLYKPNKSSFVEITNNSQNSNGQFIVLDTANTLYYYSNFETYMISTFDKSNPLMFIKSIKQNSNKYLALVFQNSIQIYDFNQGIQQLQQQSFLFEIKQVNTVRFLTNSTFLLSNQTIIHYDFIKNTQLNSIFLGNLIYFKCHLFIEEPQLLFIGLSVGKIVVYDLKAQQAVQIPLQDTSSQIVNFLVNQKQNQVLIAQKNGKLAIWSLDQKQITDNIDLQGKFSDFVKLGAELNKLWFDQDFNRIFINFQASTLIIIVQSTNFQLIQFLSFPLSQNNQISFTPSLIVLQSNAQVNFHDRSSLLLLYYIRKNYRRDQISEIITLDDSIFIVFLIKKINIFLLNPVSKRPFLIDEITVNFGQSMKVSYIDPTQKLFSVIGQTQNTIFENRYSANVYLNQGQSVCTQSVSIKDAVSAQKLFGLTFNANIAINYLFYLSIYNDLKYMAQINQNKGQFIFKPSSQQSNQLKLYSNIFTFVQGNVTMQNFQFNLPVNEILQFNANTSYIKFDNIKMGNQTINNTYFNFSNLQSVIINSLSIDNLTIQQTTDFQSSGFLQFNNIQTVHIYNLELNTIQIQDLNRSLFFFMNVKSLFIQNITVTDSNTYTFFSLQQIDSITMQNVQISNNQGLGGQGVNRNSIIMQLQGCIQTLLKNITFESNQNSILIQSSNQNQQQNQTIIYRNDVVEFTQSRIQNNTDSFTLYRSETNEGLIQLQTSTVLLSQITYLNNTGNVQIFNSQNVTLLNSNYSENLSFNGGAVKMQNIKGIININSCQYLGNNALSSGGAIFFNEVESIRIDQTTLILKNSALIGGAIRILNVNYPTINVNAQMNSNYANIYGDDIATVPQNVQIKYQDQIQIIGQQSATRNLKDSISIQNFQSGGILQMEFQFLDQNGKHVSFDPANVKKQNYPPSVLGELNYYQIQADSPNNTVLQLNGDSLVNYNQYLANSSSFFIQNLQLNSRINTQQILHLTFSKNYYTGQVQHFDIKIEFRNCQTGEIMKTISNDIIQCSECPKNSYSIIDPSSYNSTNTGVCNKCPQGSLNCQGDMIQPKNGYWLQKGTDIVIYCQNNPNACLPEDQSNQQGCAVGHFGPLCEECDYLGKYWNGRRFSSFWGDFNCEECQDSSFQYVFVIGGLLFIAFYLAFQTKRYLDNQKLMQTCYYLRIAKLVPLSKSCYKDSTSFLLKSLIHYLQLSSILLTFKVEFNPQTVYQTAGQPVVNVALNFKCFMSLNTLAKYQMANIQVLIRSLIPFTIFCFLFILLLLLKLRKKSAIKTYHFYSVMTFCFLFFLSDTIKFITDALSCRQIGNEKYLKIDVSVLCSDESYRFFVLIILIPILFFWLVYPLFMLMLIRKKRADLNSCLTKFSFGSYYAEYKEQFYYWEFIKIYLKVIVVFLFTQTYEYGPSSFFLIAIIFTAYIIALQKYQPFTNSNNQLFEILTHAMIIFNLNLQSLSLGFGKKIFDYLLAISHHSFVAIQVIVIIFILLKESNGIISKCFLCFIKCLNIKYLRKYFKVDEENNSYEVFRNWKKVYENLNLLTELKAYYQISQFQVKRENNTNNTPKQKKPTSSAVQNFLQRQVSQARENSDMLTNGMITNIIHQSSIHARQLMSPRSTQKMNFDLITNSQLQANLKSGIIEDGTSQFQSNYCLEPLTSDKNVNSKRVLSKYHSRENSQLIIQNQGNSTNRDTENFKNNLLETPKRYMQDQESNDQQQSEKESESQSEIYLDEENTSKQSPHAAQHLKMQQFKCIKK